MSSRPLTLILNPKARKPRLDPKLPLTLETALTSSSRIFQTHNLESLDALMQDLIQEEQAGKKIETLCFYGGDGSISRGLTAYLNSHPQMLGKKPEERPALLVVQGGTFNFISHLLKIKQHPLTTLDQWKSGLFSKKVHIPLLKVTLNQSRTHYGFAFAWGVGFRAMKNYYARSQHPGRWDGFMVLCDSLIASASRDAEKCALFKRKELFMKINGKNLDPASFHSVVIGSIAHINLGIKPFPPEEIRPGGFHFSANGMPLHKVFFHSPTLLFGMGDQRNLMSRNALRAGTNVNSLELEIDEGFTLDGEVFHLDGKTCVEVTAGPVFEFWSH